MVKTNIPLYWYAASFLVLVGVLYILFPQMRAFIKWNNATTPTPQPQVEEIYNPSINPADFSPVITNQYFQLPVDRELNYEKRTEEGLEYTTSRILEETKTIMGITTITFESTVKKLDDKVLMYTKAYLAQDKNGNVWLFGETVDNYDLKSGEITNHNGTWIAGENGALPGIWLKAEQVAGDRYKQEYSAGIAEDMTEVAAVNQTITVRKKTYKGCTKMYAWTPLNQQIREFKYYCPVVGALVLVEDINTNQKQELIGIK